MARVCPRRVARWLRLDASRAPTALATPVADCRSGCRMEAIGADVLRILTHRFHREPTPQSDSGRGGGRVVPVTALASGHCRRLEVHGIHQHLIDQLDHSFDPRKASACPISTVFPAATPEGILRLSRQVSEWVDDQSPAELSRISILARDYRSRGWRYYRFGFAERPTRGAVLHRRGRGAERITSARPPFAPLSGS